jgi:hypothetical protein
MIQKHRLQNLRLEITLNETLMKHVQNNQKSIKNPYQPMDVKNRKKKICEPNVSSFLPNICDFQKEKSKENL